MLLIDSKIDRLEMQLHDVSNAMSKQKRQYEQLLLQWTQQEFKRPAVAQVFSFAFVCFCVCLLYLPCFRKRNNKLLIQTCCILYLRVETVRKIATFARGTQ